MKIENLTAATSGLSDDFVNKVESSRFNLVTMSSEEIERLKSQLKTARDEIANLRFDIHVNHKAVLWFSFSENFLLDSKWIHWTIFTAKSLTQSELSYKTSSVKVA